MPWSLKTVLLGLITSAVLANLAVVDYLLFVRVGSLSFRQVVQTPNAPSGVPFTPPASATPPFCPASCLTAIQDATSAAVLKPTPTPKSQSTRKTTPKELFIPLGTGFTQSKDWVDVAGTDTAINSANYTKVTKAVFEASMHIPVANGAMYARLFNVTAGHPVWFSEVSTSAGTSIMVSSGDITLDKGSNIYRVQIRTTLEYPSYLDFARIRIMTLE